MIKVYPFLFLFLIQFLNAQLDWRRTKIGVVFGIDYSKVQHAHNPSGPRFSFYTSVFARIPLGILCACENPKFYIQPQLEYIQTGEKGLKIHCMQIII